MGAVDITLLIASCYQIRRPSSVQPYDIDAIIGSAFYCERSVLAAQSRWPRAGAVHAIPLARIGSEGYRGSRRILCRADQVITR
jgi:hypothetical protein